MNTLAPDEKIIKVIRRYWFVFILSALPIIIYLLVPFFVFGAWPILSALLNPFFVGLTIPHPPFALIFFLFSLWLLAGWIGIFAVWTLYYLDYWVITDKRIYNIEQTGFFRRQVSSCRLDRVQDIKIDFDGFLDTVLDFGRLTVQTAGEEQEFVITGVHRPKLVKDVIISAHDRAVERARSGGGLT